MKRRKVLVADLFCGAGGTSAGAREAIEELGLRMELVCVNHWPVAIATHKSNHPEARHYCQDIATVRPHVVVPEGYLDLLLASPTCTHHSVARGGKPTGDQERSDPWHIVTWFTELRVRRALIENVWEFTRWGPVDERTRRPIKAREGDYFRAWIETIRRLGGEPEWRKINCADFGDPTTRQRFLMLVRCDRRPIFWATPSHMKRREGVLPLGLKPWRPARDIIDWKLRGTSIFERPFPLAPKTLDRILAGAVKFGWPAGYILRLEPEIARSCVHAIRRDFARRHEGPKEARRNRMKRVRAAVARLRRLRSDPVSASYGGHGSAGPILVTLRNHADGRSIDSPVPALAAGGTHVGLAEPVSSEAVPTFEDWYSKTKNLGGSREEYDRLYRDVDPFILSQQNSGKARSVEEPLPTITTGGAGSERREGCARHMLVEPFIVSLRHGKEGAGPRPRAVAEPLPTLTAGGSQVALVEPFVLSRQGGGAPRSVDEPTPTQCAKHGHVLIAPYYGGGSGETCGSVEDPLPTVTSKARFGMVVPVTHADGSNRARSDTRYSARGAHIEVPLPTDHLLPLGARSPAAARRGELAFIAAAFGEREGQAPRVHDIDSPVPPPASAGAGLRGAGRVTLAEPAAEDFDILFRMLEPHELAAAMSFDDGYAFTGTKTQKVKQIGNAVPRKTAKAHVKALMRDATAKKPNSSALIPDEAERAIA